MADVYQNWVLYNVWKAIKNWTEYPFDWTMLNEYNQLVTYYDTAQQQIRTSIINKWVNVPANATIDTYPWYIDQIDTVWPNDNMRYMYAVGSIDTDVMTVGSDDYLYDMYPDYSFKDSNYLYLIKPYLLEYRGSTNNFSVYCMAIPRWWNSIISLKEIIFQFTSVSSLIVLKYYYINSWIVRLYWYEDRYNTRFWKEITLSNWVWSVTDIWRDWTEPAETGGDQGLFSTTLKWNPSGRSQCIFQWRPNQG